jgi:hypothetical protein
VSISINCSIDLTEEELLLVLMNRYYVEQYRKKEASGALCVDDVNSLRVRGAVPGMAEVIATADHDRYEAAMDAAEEAAPASTPNVTFNSPEPVEPEAATIAPTDYANTPANNAIAPEPPPLPPKPTRRAKTNGAEAPINATPLAPSPPLEPAPLDEPAMRSLLSKVGAVHPLKVKAITNILEIYGGHRRLSECDPSTWPVIAEEARKVLAEYGA